MPCPRCHGLLIPTRAYDQYGAENHILTEILRCVNCGEMIDEIIMAYRRDLIIKPTEVNNKLNHKFPVALKGLIK